MSHEDGAIRVVLVVKRKRSVAKRVSRNMWPKTR